MAEVVRQLIPTPENWNPRIDAPRFADEWIDFLREHRGEFWHPTEVWQTHDDAQRMVLREVAAEEVEFQRRLGDVIQGDRAVGYCYVRRTKVRWLRLVKAIKKEERKSRRLTPRKVALVEGQMEAGL